MVHYHTRAGLPDHQDDDDEDVVHDEQDGDDYYVVEDEDDDDLTMGEQGYCGLFEMACSPAKACHIRRKLVMQINSLTHRLEPPIRGAGPLHFLLSIIAFVSPRLTRFVAYHLVGFVAGHLGAGFVIYRRRGVNGGNKAIVVRQPACGGRHN